MKIKDNINTDYVISGRYKFKIQDPKELAKYIFEDLDPAFAARVKKGDILVAGENFGCGSSREQAVSTLKGHEIIIIARNFARIFFQNSINLGLQTITCPDVEANEGDELDITVGEVVNKTNGKSFRIEPMPKARQAIIEAGGLIAYTRKRVMEKASMR